MPRRPSTSLRLRAWILLSTVEELLAYPLAQGDDTLNLSRAADRFADATEPLRVPRRMECGPRRVIVYDDALVDGVTERGDRSRHLLIHRAQ